MADERIDIEITDKISPAVSAKIKDIGVQARASGSAVTKLQSQLTAIGVGNLGKLAQQSQVVTNAITQQSIAQAKLQQAVATATLQEEKASLTKARLATQTAKTTLEQQRLATEVQRTSRQIQLQQNAAERQAGAATRGAQASKIMSDVQQKLGETAKLSGHQIQNLVFQLNDVVVGLASGQRPLTVLLQQGSQISTVFGPGTGILAIFRGIGQAVTSMISGTTALFLAIGAGIIGILASWQSYLSDVAAVNGALQGLGRTIGGTTAQFIDMATAAASAGNLSKGFALDLAVALARTGNLSRDNIGQLIRLTKDFAATVGTDLDNAKDILVKTFSDPEKGIISLNQQMRFLDAQTLTTVQNLIRQGNRTDAVRIAVDRLPASLAKAEQATTALGRTWDRVWNGIKSAVFSVGQAIDNAFSNDAQRRLQAIILRLSTIAQLQQERPNAVGLNARLDREAERLEAEATKLTAEIEKVRQAAKARSEQSEFNRWSVEIRDLVNTTQPAQQATQDLYNKLLLTRKTFSDAAGDIKVTIGALQGYANTQNSLTRAIESGLGVDISKIKSQQDLNNAIKAANEVGRNYFDQAQRQAALDRIDQQLAVARTSSQREELARQRQFIELAGQTITTKQANQAVDAAGRLIQIETAKARANENYEIERQRQLYGIIGPQRELSVEVLNRELAARRANISYTREELAALTDRLRVLQESNRVQQQLDRIYSDILKPAQDYNDTLKAATFLFQNGTISASQYFNVLAEGKIKALEAANTIGSAFQVAFLGVARDLNNVSATIKSGVTSMFSNLENSLVDFVKTGKLNFADLARSIIADIARMIIRLLILRPLMQAISGAFGFGGGGSINVGQPLNILPQAATGLDMQVGGVNGRDRNILPIRVSQGERVTIRTPDQQAKSDKADRSGGNTSNVVVNISTPDAQSFRQSESQVQAQIVRAIKRGNRNL